MEHLFFYLGLTLITLHEIDAVRCKEWRIFPGLALLNDRIGMQLFIGAHIPLYAALFYGIFFTGMKEEIIYSLNLFFLIHVGLHLLYYRNKKNEFNNWFSWVTILVTGLFGLLDLIWPNI